MTLDDFENVTWQIKREIVDDLTGQISHFIGQARIDSGKYLEEGRLELAGGATFASTRAYLWVPTKTGIDISFDDGRFFHHLDLSQNTPEAQHFCDPDQYDVAYDFWDWPKWVSTWRVRGPRKDYKMQSVFAKLPSQ